MNVSIEAGWQRYLDDLVQTGRYGSAEDVVSDALALLKDREAKLQALRDKIDAAIAGGGAYTSEEVLAHAKAGLRKFERSPAAQ